MSEQPTGRRRGERTEGTGRRTATGRRLNPAVVLAVLLPLLTIGALLLVQTHDEPAPPRPPDERPLTQAALGCPSGDGKGDALGVATSLDDVEGEVLVAGEGPADPSPVPVRSGEVADATADVAAGSGVVRAEGELAPGLLAVRSTGEPLAATSCALPRTETWFSGVGAGGSHSSTLELVNPDGGDAVADVLVYSASGQLDAPELRGVTVRGHRTLRLDLAEAFPRRPELGIRVVVSRGRLAASVLDTVPDLGSRPASSDWLPAEPAPDGSVLLLGLPAGDGDDELTVTNPGDSEVRATVRIVTEDAAFAPQGLEELRVPPQSSRQLTLSSVLRDAVAKGALGIRVDATGPVTAGLRSVVADDLSAAAPVLPLGAPVTLPVPDGEASLVLGDAAGAGVATITTWTADGRQLEEERVELTQGSGGTVELPKDAALVRVTPRRTTVHAALLLTGGGTTVLGLAEPVTSALVPDVAPGLP